MHAVEFYYCLVKIKFFSKKFLEPDYVTEKILEAILTNQKVVFIPRILHLLHILKGYKHLYHLLKKYSYLMLNN